jgi:hypothetical protein
MITIAQCHTHLAECRATGIAPGISIVRATAAMAVCLALTRLAEQVAKYEAIVADEAR